ncbi:MAG: sulfotransferase [Maricaulaceae bacterium]|nr:sulfotransferase [Maricaulaceae bacterium]
MSAGTRLQAGMICGAGHSGSTLLGMMLGSHSRAFYAGEAGKVRYLGDPAKPLRKRACKLCGEACPVWGGFVWDRARPLYHQIAERAGKPVVIDSTKDHQWIAERAAEFRAAGGRPALFFLLRDGRAVVNSRLRKYPDREPEQQVRDWMAQIERSQALYDAFDGAKMRVRYEELATNPERVIRGACALLELDYEPAMLDYHAAGHHPLGGNSGAQFLAARALPDGAQAAFATLNGRTRDYYANHDASIQLDLRWRRELSEDHANLFERIAGEFNRPMKWGE